MVQKPRPWRRAVVHLTLSFLFGSLLALLLSTHDPFSVAASWTPAFHVSPSPTRQSLLIVVTATTSSDEGPLKAALLGRTAQALALVPPPLVWLVVEPEPEVRSTAALLRRSTVMYRHLPSDVNSSWARGDQMNVGLAHVQKHRLDGIVLFAPLSAVFDLRLFDRLRETQAMVSAWLTAEVAAGDERVAVEGPVCRASRVVGWRSLSSNGDLTGVAFNSSILWQRNSSDLAEGFVGLVQRVVLEEGDSVEAVPSPDCDRVMTWHHTMR